MCDRKGALWALKSNGRSAPCSSERESEVHGTHRSPLLLGLFSSPTLRQRSHLSLPLWMNPARTNTVVIRGKKSDGLGALAQTASIKVITFVGLYL